ncbi:MAG: hypothetical protein COB15_16965 [Flavobacteriales bacterium]|nr:MAG: hypothetical protein COB15_16965 [Flavobacteriales bacterium]
MIKIRDKFWFKGIAVFMAIQFLNMIFTPALLMAQNTGPVAPEAVAFEPVDATDMVSLLTGDVSYVLPLLTVPSPEGGYPLALSYHAGITMKQEASWVGLGWNINPGAVNRSVVGYPDDWRDKKVTSIVSNSGGSETLHTLSMGYGYNGVGIGTNFSWGSNKAFGGSVGLSYGIPGSNFGVNASVGESGASIGAKASLFPSANKGQADPNGGKVNPSIGVSLGTKGVNATVNSGLGISFSTNGTSSRIAIGGVGIPLSQTIGASDFNTYTIGNFNIELMVPTAVGTFSLGYGDNTHYYQLYEESDKHINGPLYFGGAYYPDPAYIGLLDTDHIMDVNTTMYNKATSSLDYIEKASKNNFVYPAYDNFTVSAQGLSGSMQPRIYEFGEIYAESKVLKKHPANSSNDPQKARYENRYHYHPGDKLTRTPNQIHFNFDYSNTSYLKVEGGSYTGNGVDALWGVTTTESFTSQINGESNYNTGTKRKGGGKYVEWFSNRDIINDPNGVKARGFIETLSIKESRTNQEYFDPEGIGAYAITTEDGKTYHYSLPVYQFENFFIDDTHTTDFMQKKLEKYAYTWLLTAVTGPDYVDMPDANNELGSFDKNDFGYWVNLDYGKWTDGYFWQLPYNNVDEPYSFGRKQIYYLNSINTRSHTAYFIKNIKEDGLGKNVNLNKPFTKYELKHFGVTFLSSYWNCCFDGSVNQTQFYIGNHTFKSEINVPEKHKTMKLEKIILVKNEDATLLPSGNIVSPTLISNAPRNGGEIKDSELFEFRKINDNPNNNYKSVGRQEPTINFNIYYKDNVLDIYDYDQSTFDSQAIKIIEFNHDYSLATGSENSSAPSTSAYNSGGRLTLNSVKILGKGGADILPDYNFDYYNNLGYDKNKIDEWGYHKDNPENWSLKEIETPLGSKIYMNYEEDTYYAEAIDPTPIYGTVSQTVPITGITGTAGNYQLNIASPIVNYNYSSAIGVKLHITSMDQFCLKSFSGVTNMPVKINDITSANYNVQIVGSGTNSWSVTGLPTNQADYFDINNSGTDYYDDCYWTNASGYIELISIDPEVSNFTGGGIRVQEITIEDELSNNYITSYDYNDPNTGITSGITSYAPKESQQDRYIPYAHDIPTPGVMYEYVTVENRGVIGKAENKTAYHFEVLKPSQNVGSFNFKMGDHISVNDNQQALFGHPIPFVNHTYNVTSRNTTIIDNTAALGRLISTSVIGDKNLIQSKTTYDYKDINEIQVGISQESFKSTKRHIDLWDNTHVKSQSLWHYNTSSKIEYPSVIKSVTTTSKGQSSTVYYDEYDFNTGKPLVTRYENSWGDEYKTEAIPAYAVNTGGHYPYAKMGSKVWDATNKNMLVQDAATYLYKTNRSSPDDIVSASIQTWEDDWDYREFVAANSRYEDIPEVTASNKVWRKHKNYTWKAHINTDGTYKDSGADAFKNYDWSIGASSSQNPRWKKVNEVTKYNRYSHPLESKDLVDKFVATKMGYNETRVLTSSVNAKYTDFGFSGAEDEVINNHFGGELYKGTTSTIYDAELSGNDSKYVHTGSKSLNVGDGQWGFVYKNDEYESSRKYKASVWVHESNSSEARIAVSMKNAGGTSVHYYSVVVNANTPKSGEWYLLETNIPNNITNASYLEVQAYNPSSGGGAVYFDDFMVHPATAPMTSYVYDDKTGLVTAIIDNNGMAVKYEYDDAGRLITSYREIIGKGFVKVAEHEYNYASQ